MKLSVIGLGKLGTPMVVALASRGFDVIGLDLNRAAVDSLNAGIAHIEEPLVQDLLTEHRSRIRATTDWATAINESDATFIIVPTPSGSDGAFRNDYVLSALEEIGRVLRRKPGYHLVVVNSTTMPGSMDGPIRAALEAAAGRSVGPSLGLCYNPEFIALGDVVNGLLHPDFVLIGEADAKAGAMLEGIYRQLHGAEGRMARMSMVNAELTKISVNTYVTTKISFANMLSEICDTLPGADAEVVTSAIGLDSRIGRKYLRPATGYGGPCFPRDTVAFATMARQVGAQAVLAEATHTVNERQARRLVEHVVARTRAGGRVAILGLSYKPDTPVIERSQSVLVGLALAERGFAVTAHDPLAMDAARTLLGSQVQLAGSAQDAVRQADTVVLMVPWQEYRGLSSAWFAGASPAVIIDCWRCLDPASLPAGAKLVHPGRHDRALEDAAALTAAE